MDVEVCTTRRMKEENQMPMGACRVTLTPQPDHFPFGYATVSQPQSVDSMDIIWTSHVAGTNV